MVDREIAEIEAVIQKHLRLVIAMRAGVEHAAGIDGVRQAAMEIAALRSKDREDGALPKVLATGWLKTLERRDGEERGPVVEFVIDASKKHAMTFGDIWSGAEHQIAALPLSTEQTEAGDA